MDSKNIRKNSKFDNLEQSLYDPADEVTRIRTGSLHPETVEVERDWSKINEQNSEKQKIEEDAELLKEEIITQKKSSFFRKFFMSSLLFFLVAIGFGVYTFFIKNKLHPEGNITIGVIGSTFTQAGESLPLTIEIENKNKFPLQVVDLIVEYPREGEKPTASLETTERDRISLGTIEAGQHITKEVPLTLFGKEGDKKEIHFTLEYSVEQSSAIFQKEKIYIVTLNSSPITTRIIGSNIAVPNQPYRFTVEVSTNTKKPLDNILAAVQYPIGFTYTSANLEPISSNNIFDMGTLIPGAPKQIEINGTFTGLEGDERSIRALFGTYLSTDKTKISTNLGTLLQTVLLQKPFLSTELVINSSGEDVVALSSGEQIQGQILWKNNLPNQVLDLEIQVKLKGDLLDREKIEANDGFYNSGSDSIIWNKNTLDSFVRVPANSNGTLYFTIPMRDAKTDGTEKNPQVEFEVTVRGLEDSEGTTPKTIESLERVIGRVGGNAKLMPQVRYITGVFQNTGAYPPKVNTETTYTVELNVRNSINAYGQGEVRAKLPPNVTYKGVFSPATELVSFDDKTGEVIWRAGEIQASGDTAKSVSLQLHVTPSLQQVGSFLPLLNTITFKALDKFTNQQFAQDLGTITNEIRDIFGEDTTPANGRVTN